MSYATIGFGNIGKALAKAFARKGIAVSVATTRDPESFAVDAARLGLRSFPRSWRRQSKRTSSFGQFVSSRTSMSRTRCPPGRGRASSM